MEHESTKPGLEALEAAARAARAYLASLADRPVGASATLADLRAALGGPLPAQGADPAMVVTDLARSADGGLVASAGPRYFGFVIGGSLPAALGADWLTSAWDQNAGIYATSPAAAVVEEIAAQWLLSLFGLPSSASVGFVTGGQMANTACLAAARHAVLRRTGWDVEQRGLYGAPEIEVVVGAEAHVTVLAGLRVLGLGAGRVRVVPADGQGRMRPEAVETALERGAGPMIVCAQAGNVNTGSFDPFDRIAPLARSRGAWLHVDAAFGLWAAASPAHRHLVSGVALADSWATDGHKWLNVPYDSGFAIVADAAAHHAAFSADAAYLEKTSGEERDPEDWVPEFSRRARGFPVYAALRSLGREGVSALVDRCCAHARAIADRLRRAPGVEILNDVVLNQVLVRFTPRSGADADAFTRDVVQRVQRDGTCWLSGTTWQGRAAMRISLSGWSTTAADVARSADAILGAAAA